MKRGDVVIVVLPGDYGKPRPAIVVQGDAMLRGGPSSIVLCPTTTSMSDRKTFRVRLQPSAANGLHAACEIMTEKITAAATHRIGSVVGELDANSMRQIDAALCVVLGLIDAGS